MRTTLVCGLLVWLAAAPVSGRERVLVPPFAASDRWSESGAMGLGAAVSMEERLARTGCVKVVSVVPMVRQLLQSGVSLQDVCSADEDAARSLGEWAGASQVVVGRVGDRTATKALGRLLADAPHPGGAGQWLAAVAIDVSTGARVGTAVVWCRRAELTAVTFLSRAADMAPSSNPYQDLLASALAEYDRYQEALETLADLLTDRPDDVGLLLRAGRCARSVTRTWRSFTPPRAAWSGRTSCAGAHSSWRPRTRPST